MERKKQDKSAETPTVSPLANEKTYGERVYSRIFDWGLNYWTNLLASAGFSQWAEHGTNRIKLPFMDPASPREYQQKLAKGIREWKYDPGMQGLPGLLKIGPFKGFKNKMQERVNLGLMSESEKEFAIFDRSMARARSLTLLIPGFLVMIPSVWLGAKIKPWLVEKLNAHHYGKEALDDPSLQARHQAIKAEQKPTFLGTLIARIGTMVAVQVAAQGIGSRNNLVNELGGKHSRFLKNFAIDPITEHAGESIGGAVPRALRTSFNAYTTKHGLDWSNHQIGDVLKGFASTQGIAIKQVNPEKLAETTAELIQLRRATPIIPSMGRTAIRGAIAQRETGTKNILERFITSHNVPVKGTIQLTGELHKLTIGKYDNAGQDLGRFIAADTFYTLISAGTIRPFLKLLKYVPGMSYKPKTAANSPTLDGDKIKVPANRYADQAPVEAAPPAANDPIGSELARATPAANDKRYSNETPNATVTAVQKHATLAANPEQKRT